MSNKNIGKYAASVSKKPNKKKKSFKKRWRRIKQNRFFQIGLAILACLLISVCSRFYQYNIDKNNYNVMMEAQKAEIIAEYEEKMYEQQINHEEEIQNIRASYEEVTYDQYIQKEAEYIARVLYGTARNNSERDQRTVVWCILNRVDSIGYPGTVKEVCQQESQWMGYSDNNPILNNLYDIAKRELETWYSGYRPVAPEYVYMSWSSSQIILRDTWENKTNTNYWQAG